VLTLPEKMNERVSLPFTIFQGDIVTPAGFEGDAGILQEFWVLKPIIDEKFTIDPKTNTVV